MSFGALEITRFPDGEADLWPIMQSQLTDGGAINSHGKELCEAERDDIISRLAGYAIRKNVVFSITPPENVYYTDEKLLDQWGYGLTTDGSAYGIQIPRHVVAKRPAPGEGVEFRRDIPAYLIASWMAHELSHHDRRLDNPDRYQYVHNYSSDPEDVREEELLTDADAYWLLHRKAIHLTPDDYTSSTPKDPAYHYDLSNLLAEVDSHGPIR
ncbi:MAG TPA: hypothetical protein VLA92_03785 [Candidatus Saccharimonadales bacterium]|nr:hypothetical protein [Candidatus Saccharimonadales bacterium]